MEVLSHIRPYLAWIFPYMGLKVSPIIYGTYLQLKKKHADFPYRMVVAPDVSVDLKPHLPFDKHTNNYGESPCLMGKLTINGKFQ